ncbi:MAG: DUF4290 domain-containing protein [Flavobacteriales bacterium]|nr:DUF4290 domain-containing protein [Flavobacteriales bacterium]
MIDNNDTQHFGLSYNTDRTKLKIPEYGRTLQQMVDHCVALQDRDRRNAEANAIINVMGEINPHLRNVPDFQHKLWDQLFIMSDFKIDIDSPFPTPTPETFSTPPDRLEYPSVLNKYRYYGHYIRSMIDIACSWESGEKQDALVIAIAKHMKKAYLEWNKDLIEDEVIGQHLEELSGGKINFSHIKSLLPNGELGTPNAQGIPVKKRFVPQNGVKKVQPNKNKNHTRK